MKKRDEDFIPVGMLVFYQQTFAGSTYVEYRKVHKTEEGLIYGNARPLKPGTLKALMQSAYNHNGGDSDIFDDYFLDSSILAMDTKPFSRKIIWWRPEQTRTILFNDRIPLPSTEYPLPAMLFYVNRDTIKVYAMKTGKKRPDKKTELFHAPIFNMVQKNEICWGNVKLQGESVPPVDEEVKTWEQRMWNSFFSEVGSTQLMRDIPITEAYQQAKEKGKFNLKHLAPVGITINNLLEEWK